MHCRSSPKRLFSPIPIIYAMVGGAGVDLESHDNCEKAVRSLWHWPSTILIIVKPRYEHLSILLLFYLRREQPCWPYNLTNSVHKSSAISTQATVDIWQLKFNQPAMIDRKWVLTIDILLVKDTPQTCFQFKYTNRDNMIDMQHACQSIYRRFVIDLLIW